MLARKPRERGALPTGGAGELVNNRLGSGSDYTVFLNFLGVPIADLSFDGPYGVYHSIYDNHNWVARIGDPGFLYHVSLVQIWGLMAMRLADADVVPLDYVPYAQRISEFAQGLERRWTEMPVLSCGCERRRASSSKPPRSSIRSAIRRSAARAKLTWTR